MKAQTKNKPKSFIKKSLMLAGASGVIFMSYLFGLAKVEHELNTRSKRIENSAQLDSLLKIERQRLGISDSIEIIPQNSYDGGCSSFELIPKKIYGLKLLGSTCSTQTSLRHELKHIDDRIKGNIEEAGGLAYLFWNEPRAVLYEIRTRHEK